MSDLDKGSPMWWVQLLAARLQARQERYALLAHYADGDHPLPEGSAKHRDLYRQWQRRSRTNYCGLAASSVTDRLQVEGFRSGAGGNDMLDAALWQLWQSNHLDADSDMVHAAAAERSDTYVIVGHSDATGPLITAEQPENVIVDTDPMNARLVRAALKVWLEDDVAHSRLYLPGMVIPFAAAAQSAVKMPLEYLRWEQVGEPELLPFDVVPVVRFVNRGRLSGEGLAEFEDAIDIQDRINTLTLLLLTIAQSQAFRQRYIKGFLTADADGNPIEPPFEALVSSLWTVEDTDVEFGEFQQVDLTPLLDALQSAVTAFITVTGLPPHYVAGDLVNASADALAAAESRLVAKVRARQRAFGESWEQVMRIAGAWTGMNLPNDIEIQWADPERKTSAQLADAALKASQIGVPWDAVMAMLQYSPQEIDRLRGQRQQELAFRTAVAVADAQTALTAGGDADTAA